MIILDILGYAARMWFYFRTGYSTYLIFMVGALNTLVVIWYLAIGNMPSVQTVFSNFALFAIIVSLVGIPLSILLGFVHYKGSRAYAAELDIGVEANPYYYKVPPGYNREVFTAFYLELLIQIKRILSSRSLLDDHDKSRIEDLERKLEMLIQGLMVGLPGNHRGQQ